MIATRGYERGATEKGGGRRKEDGNDGYGKWRSLREDGENLCSSIEAKSGAEVYYEVRVGRVGQADHTSVASVWQMRWPEWSEPASYSHPSATDRASQDTSRCSSRIYQPRVIRRKTDGRDK